MANDDMLKRIQKRLRNAGYELETILTDDIKEDYINNAFNSAGVFKPKIDILGDMGYFEIENTGDIEDQEGFVGENRYYLTLNFNPHIWPQNEETKDLLFNDEVSRQQRFENNIKFELKVLEILKKKGILKSSWTVGEYGVDSAVNFNPLYEGSAFIYINDFTPRIDACSHENLSIKTMEVLNGELLLTLDCDKCGKRTSTSASLNQGWEAEDLNTWAQQELSSHGKNVSFKDFIKKEIKSHGNIDLVDWAKHEKQSHTKKYGAEYENIGTMQSSPASGYNGYMNMMSSARRIVEIGNETGLDQKLGEAYQDESGRWFLPILQRKASESFSLDSKKADSINMEEPVIEEPSFIPDGDGRAIGQQNSSINLSPLHAESKSMFGKDKNGKMYARRRNGRIITHNAETIHEKGDYRIIAEDDDTWDKNWTDSAKEMAEEYGVYTLKVQKKVMGGWETIDGLSGVIASDYGADSLKDFALSDMIIPEGVNFDAESFNAETFDASKGMYMTGHQVDNYLNMQKEIEELRAFKKLVSDTVKQQQGPHLRAMLKELLTMDFNAEREDISSWFAVCPSCGSDNWGEQEGYECRDCNHVFNPYNAESEAATYSPSSSPDMVNEIQTSPTNESPQLFNASNTFNVTSALGISGLVVAALSLPMLYSSAKSRLGKSAEEKRKASGSVRRNHTQVKNSEYSVGQVNPVEAEGQQDIHGAEGITNPRHAPSASPAGYPSKSLKMW